MSRVLGIDPGNTGALAFLDDDGDIREIEDMPVVAGFVNPALLVNLIVGYGPIKIAVVEAVHSHPKQGVASVWKFGVGYGMVHGVLAALKIPVVHAQPGVWKKRWGLIGKDKGFSRQRAMERWPTHSDTFKRVKDDGRAEACLMAAGWIIENRQARSKRPVPAAGC